MNDMIERYFEANNAPHTRQTCEICRYTAVLGGNGRLAHCGVTLRFEAAKLYVMIELPVTIRRGEVSRVLRELDCINDDLENGCYTVDPFTGILNYVYCAAMPDDESGVRDIVNRCIITVEEDYTTVMQLVINEIIKIENEAQDPARIKAQQLKKLIYPPMVGGR